jgi:hypothetical protein
VPLFKNVFVVVMADTSLATLEGSTNTPYLHALEKSAAVGAQYHGVGHPSLANYLAMTSGSTQGVLCNCDPSASSGSCGSFNCNSASNLCGCPQSVTSIADQLDAAGMTWASFAEGGGPPCNLTSAGNYDVHHVPLLYYSSVQGNPTRCNSHIVDYSLFITALDGILPSFAFITPNTVDDMAKPYPRDATNLPAGDTWLSNNVGPLLNSTTVKQGGLVVVVWDEGDVSVVPTDDPIPIFVMSPYAKTNYRSPVSANHYSLLATIEDGLDLPRLGSGVTPLADYFPAN